MHTLKNLRKCTYVLSHKRIRKYTDIKASEHYLYLDQYMTIQIGMLYQVKTILLYIQNLFEQNMLYISNALHFTSTLRIYTKRH